MHRGKALLLLCLSIVWTAAGALQRPPTILFGFYQNMNDAVLQFDGPQLYAGIKAAEKEVNEANIVEGVTLEFRYMRTATLASPAATVTSTAYNASMTPDLFGMILPDWASSQTMLNVGRNFFNSTLPIIGARQLSDLAFANDSRFSVALRQPPSTEYLMMLHHAANSEDARCTSFAVLTRTFFNFAGIAPALAMLGLPPPVMIPLGANVFAPPNLTYVFDTWLRGGSTGSTPMCGLFFCTFDDAHYILSAMYNDPRFDVAHMTFFAAGLTSEGVWSSTLNGTAPFRQLRFITNFPDPNSTVAPLSIRYRAALAKWLATVNMTEVPADMKLLPFRSEPTYAALEGYMVVKWIAEILSSMPSINRTLFLDAIYKRRYFFVDDTSLGPLTDRCLVGAEDRLPCFCNAAVGTISMSRVDSSSGLAAALQLDAVQAPTTTMDISLGDCYLTPALLRTPIVFGVWSPLVNTPAGLAVFSDFHRMMRLLSSAYNAGGRSPTTYQSATWMNEVMPYLSGESTAAYFARMHATRRTTVIVGDWFANVSAPVVNIIAAPYTLYEDAPLTTATAFSRYSWTLKPTLADLAHGIALNLRKVYDTARAGRTPKVFVAAENAQGHRVAVASLHTVQFAVEGGGASNLSDAATLRAAIGAAAAVAAGGRDAILFLSTITSPIAVDAVNALVELTAAVEAESAAKAATMFEHLVVAIATDQNNLYRAKFQASMIGSALSRFPIYFGSYAYAFWEPQNAGREKVAAILNTTAPTLLESIAFHAGLLVSELFTYAIEAATTLHPTAADLMDVLYGQVSVTANAIQIGPIYDAVCSADVVAANEVDRECQCHKILRTINVFDFRGWLLNNSTYNPQFSWQMSTCGVRYEPLRGESSLNAALIAGIAAPCGAAAVGALFYFACCFGRRSNRSAPKDASVPFAMVFTDIQSSTSLWGRAPEQMGVALDKHHELLRELLARHGGYEVKTIGDSFMVAFKRASDAASFALAIQTTLFAAEWPPEIDDVYVALAQEAHEELLMSEDPKKAAERQAKQSAALNQWEDEVNYPLNWNGIRVRVGLHWGVGSVKLDPVSQGYDYYGTLVNTAARVESVGNGGQVLATKDLYAQLEEEQFDFGDVDIVALGPQPLRGLDQPVPLYQLSPFALRHRQIGALRLDMDVDMDDSSDGTVTTGADGQTVTSGTLDETPDAMLTRLLRKHKADGGLNEHLLRVVHFLETLLRTSPMAWRRETVKTLLKKWHVHARKPREKEAAEVTLAYDLVLLSARVGLAAEEARKLATERAERGTDGGSDAASSTGRGARLTKRQSSFRRASHTSAASAVTS